MESLHIAGQVQGAKGQGLLIASAVVLGGCLSHLPLPHHVGLVIVIVGEAVPHTVLSLATEKLKPLPPSVPGVLHRSHMNQRNHQGDIWKHIRNHIRKLCLF